MMNRILLASILLFAPSACALFRTPETKQECEEDGGSWESRGLLAKPQCVYETADSGRACKDSSECEGICVAPAYAKPGDRVTGSCAASTTRLGTCLAEVKAGKAGFALCVD